MSDPGATDNGQLFDLAARLDTLAIGLSPAQSIAMLDAVMAQTAGMAMFNAVSSQQNAAIVRSAAVTMACTALLSVPLASKVGAVAGAAPGGAETSATAPAQTPPTPAPPASDEPTETSKGGYDPAPSTSSTAPGAEGPHRIFDSQIIDAINQTQKAVMAPQVVLASGQGKAFQVVAQAAAIAVQDAGDALRAVSTIAATASAAAMARFLATGDEKYLVGIATAQEMVVAATNPTLWPARPWPRFFATFRGPVQTSRSNERCYPPSPHGSRQRTPARSRRIEVGSPLHLTHESVSGESGRLGGCATGNCE